MPMRRRSTFYPTRRAAPARRMQWVRELQNSVTFPNPQNIDLLNLFRLQFNVAANFPDIVIERVHLTVSARYTITTPGANTGICVAMWTDSLQQVQLNAVADPYAQHYMIFDTIYQTEQQMQAGAVGATGDVAFRRYDVKSKRKLRSIQETLWLQLIPVGAIVATDWAYTMSMLVKF